MLAIVAFLVISNLIIYVKVLERTELPFHATVEESGPPKARPETEGEISAKGEDVDPDVVVLGLAMCGQIHPVSKIVDDAYMSNRNQKSCFDNVDLSCEVQYKEYKC
ncbi:hypothetical protein PanWU01x14_297810 [Parasponia andersonii]|uniref:Uncharacterized protein n=1 Tax=Parasponia andersonii TaxID=3476 RepID=A0A2P5AV37_PARAD|nr:hypothetical protein PanWU01x14_297810 [Parasponia andersonii]